MPRVYVVVASDLEGDAVVETTTDEEEAKEACTDVTRGHVSVWEDGNMVERWHISVADEGVNKDTMSRMKRDYEENPELYEALATDGEDR